MTSRTLASSSGSVENLNVSTRHGCNPHSRHTWATLTLLTPSSFASRREDQCVTPSRAGGASNVRSTISVSSIVRGRPGFGRSASPPMPSAAYRFFHAITVGLDTPTRLAISFVPTPSAASSTIRARCASPARTDGARNHPARTSRSRGDTSTATGNDMSHDPVKWPVVQYTSLAEHLEEVERPAVVLPLTGGPPVGRRDGYGQP